MRVKAAILIVDGAERYLVIPYEADPEDMQIGQRTLSFDVIAHCSTQDWAEKIAGAINKLSSS